jgi:hypothetical protein
MIADSIGSHAEITARLARSRTRLRHLLTPEDEDRGTEARAANGDFPRSRTMRILTSGRTLTVLATVAGALLVARPQALTRLARLIPVATIARLLINRYVTGAMTHRGDKS